MVNVGEFQILRVSLSAIDHKPSAVTARCHPCGHVTAAHGAQLAHYPGGVVLICSNCRLHETVADEVLLELHESQVARWSGLSRADSDPSLE